jgi:hypothetical protein
MNASIPDWVPSTVATIAQVLPDVPIRQRLLTDHKMKGVWKQLGGRKTLLEKFCETHSEQDVKRIGRRLGQRLGRFSELSEDLIVRAVNGEADARMAYAEALIEEQVEFYVIGLDILEKYGFDQFPVSINDRACAALFVHVVQKVISLTAPANLRQNVWTREDAKKWAEKEWDVAAALSEGVANDPMFDAEFRRLAAAIFGHFKEGSRLLKTKGNVVDLGQNDAPYILPSRSSGSRGDDRTRAAARVIAIRMKELFGQRMSGTVRAITNVALEESVSIDNVKDWCKDLPE